MDYLSALCVLGIVVIGLLLTVNAITVEQAGSALLRCLAALLLAMWAVCILRGLAAAALPALKTLTTWAAIVGLVLVGILVIGGLIPRISKRLPNKVTREGGEL